MQHFMFLRMLICKKYQVYWSCCYKWQVIVPTRRGFFPMAQMGSITKKVSPLRKSIRKCTPPFLLAWGRVPGRTPAWPAKCCLGFSSSRPPGWCLCSGHRRKNHKRWFWILHLPSGWPVNVKQRGDAHQRPLVPVLLRSCFVKTVLLWLEK